MGNFNSGGHNRTHGRVEEYSRIDSFAFYRHLMGDKYLSYKTTVQYHRGDIIYHVQSRTAMIKESNIQDRGYRYVALPLSRLSGIDGKSVRMYFHCPYCGRRVRYLYDYYNHHACRKCAKLNYGIQQRSGLDLLRRKMYSLVVKKLQYVDWKLDYPDIPIQDLWHIPKPRYMRWAKYDALMEEYRRLQEEYEEVYNDSLLKALGRINKLLG